MEAEGEANYTVDIEHGVAVVRVFRRPELLPSAVVGHARALRARSEELSRSEDVRGMVLDLRRVGGPVSPEVEEEYRAMAGEWEATGQPLAILSIDPLQKMQVTRILATSASRFGAVFTDRNEARRFVGATSIDPATSYHELLAGTRPGSK